MVTFSTNEWAILLLVLVLGWLLGLLSRSGGAKWRRAYKDEEAQRHAAEARANAAEARLAEVERVAAARPAAAPVSVRERTPVSRETGRDDRDDLALIHGIGLSGQTLLNEVGIFRYRQITGLNAQDMADLEARLGARPGTIEREEWREQAGMLADGDREAHRSRYTV